MKVEGAEVTVEFVDEIDPDSDPEPAAEAVIVAHLAGTAGHSRGTTSPDSLTTPASKA